MEKQEKPKEEREPFALLAQNEGEEHQRNLAMLLKQFAGRIDEEEIKRLYEEFRKDGENVKVKQFAAVTALNKVRDILSQKLRTKKAGE